jgi:uncharacterized protein YybS (DUF2232 family)
MPPTARAAATSAGCVYGDVICPLAILACVSVFAAIVVVIAFAIFRKPDIAANGKRPPARSSINAYVRSCHSSYVTNSQSL